MSSMFVYVIMPVSSDPTYADKRRILREVAAQQQIRLHLPLEARPTGDPYPSSSPEQVLDDLAAADLVVADLSLARPSCYFETGLAQALRKPVVLIARSLTNIHQVFERDSVEFYADLDEYRRLLEKTLQPVGSPVRLTH